MFSESATGNLDRNSRCLDARGHYQSGGMSNTEKAGDDVIAFAEIKVTHIRCKELCLRHLSVGNGQQPRVKVETIGFEAESAKMFDVLSCAAADIKNRLGSRVVQSDQPCDAIRLRGVVLEGLVDRVIKLSGFRKHKELWLLPDG